MDRLDDYIQIMIKSLEKKNTILERIIDLNKKQALIISENISDDNWSKFNIIVSEKEAEIERINQIDEGFQALYDRIGEQIKDKKDDYDSEIRRVQELIRILEEKSIAIRTGEERNRVELEKIFKLRKKDIKESRTSLKVAANYYKAMSNAVDLSTNSVVDKKK